MSLSFDLICKFFDCGGWDMFDGVGIRNGEFLAENRQGGFIIQLRSTFRKQASLQSRQ